MAMGNCSESIRPYVDAYLGGCMPKPADAVFCLYSTLNYPNYLVHPLHNKHLFTMVCASIQLVRNRRKLLKQGIWLDCPIGAIDQIFEPCQLNESEQQRDFVEWKLPPMSNQQQKEFLADENIKSLIIHKFKSITY
jgi:hypothetical protein